MAAAPVKMVQAAYPHRYSEGIPYQKFQHIHMKPFMVEEILYESKRLEQL